MNTKAQSPRCDTDSRVSIVNDRNKIRLLVSLPSGRKSLSLGLNYTPKNLKLAEKIRNQIDTDILFNRFNGDLKAYRPGYVPKLEIVPTPSKITEINPKTAIDLKAIWDLYKKHKKDSIRKCQQNRFWPKRDRIIDLLDSQNLLLVDQASDALEFLLTKYSYSTLDNHFKDFRSAINLAIDLGKYEGKNYYAAILKTFPKRQKKEIQAYTKAEMNTIVEAFKSDRYCPDKSGYKHSYYSDFVEFRFLTGMRPSEAIALTWDDIKQENDRQWIVTNKAFCDGILSDETKTGEIRNYPIFPQLRALIDRLPNIPNEHNLIFPSIRQKGYIHSDNFLRRYWHCVVRDGLFKDGLISKYLPFYDERHSCATALIQSGLDIATIAKMLGNSSDVLMKHYLAGRETLHDLPDLF